jgi:hypothetical protein
MAAVVLGANPRLLSRRIRYDGAAAARFEVALS